jgi:hypothetical protein
MWRVRSSASREMRTCVSTSDHVRGPCRLPSSAIIRSPDLLTCTLCCSWSIAIVVIPRGLGVQKALASLRILSVCGSRLVLARPETTLWKQNLFSLKAQHSLRGWPWHIYPWHFPSDEASILPYSSCYMSQLWSRFLQTRLEIVRVFKPPQNGHRVCMRKSRSQTDSVTKFRITLALRFS